MGLKRILGAVGLAGVLALGLGFGDRASAQLQNPGPGMGCTAGTDDCSGWVASKQQPTCVAYNVHWNHYFTGALYSFADYHVVIDQWWNGGAACGGVAPYMLRNVADIYVQDWELPHTNIGPNSQGYVEFVAHQLSGVYGSYNTVAWTPCYVYSGSVSDADDAYIAYASQPGATYVPGRQAITPAGNDVLGATCNAGPAGGMSVDGAWVTWSHGLGNFGIFGQHYMSWLYLK